MTKLEKMLNYEGVFIGGHRGFSAKYPENSLLAVMEAIELGVDLVEVDVYLSKDGVPVLAHDYSLQRCAGIPGVISDFTCAQLKAMDFGLRRGKQFEGLRLPTLMEFLDMMKGYPEVLMDIDFKVWSGSLQTAKTAIREIEEMKLLERCVFNSIDCDIVEYIFDHHGKRTIGAPYFYPWIQNFRQGENGTHSKLWGVCIPHKDMSQEVVTQYRDMGIAIVCTPADTVSEVNNSIALGTTLPLCNDPRNYLKIAADKGIRYK